jgi:propanediol dehydratase small subunit
MDIEKAKELVPDKELIGKLPLLLPRKMTREELQKLADTIRIATAKYKLRKMMINGKRGR